jgi:hypothetical protein
MSIFTRRQRDARWAETVARLEADNADLEKKYRNERAARIRSDRAAAEANERAEANAHIFTVVTDDGDLLYVGNDESKARSTSRNEFWQTHVHNEVRKDGEATIWSSRSRGYVRRDGETFPKVSV